ncbi:MAG: exosortase A [Alphaproteobacteria bacterium]
MSTKATAATAPKAGPGAWATSSAVFAVAVLAVVVLFWPTLAVMEATWRASDSYQHTYVVPFVIAYLVWENRDRLAALTPRAEPMGLLFMLAATLIWLLGEAANVQLVQQLGLIGIFQSLVLTLFGWRVVGVLWFPLFFLIFLVPLGEFLVPVLQRWTADFLVWSVELIGLPIETDGYLIQVSDGTKPYHFFEVAKECSGIRYLTVMFQIGLLASYLLFKSWPRRMGVVLFAVMVPIVANWIRALGIVLIVYYTEGRHGQDIDHIIYGFWFFLFVLLIFVGICWLIADFRPEATTRHHAPPMPAQPVRMGLFGLLAVAVGAVGPAYAGFTQPSLPNAISAPALPQEAEGWRQMTYRGIDWHPVIAGADAESIARYTNGPQKIDLYVGYFDHQRQGSEVINAQNDMAGPRWTMTGIGGATEFESRVGPVPASWSRIIGRDRQRAVFVASRVDGKWAVGTVAIKLATVRARLLGGDKSASIVALATDYEGDIETARAAIQSFVSDHAPFYAFEEAQQP